MLNDKQSICVVLCTIPKEKVAKIIINELLNNKFAACISVLTNIKSYYLWNNIKEKKKEIQLLIKSNYFLKDKIITTIKNYHTYKCPEILICNVEAEYIYYQWIKNSLNI